MYNAFRVDGYGVWSSGTASLLSRKSTEQFKFFISLVCLIILGKQNMQTRFYFKTLSGYTTENI
jgi:hypothetical protein